MKNNCSREEIAAVLRDHQRFVVMSHVRPDGDALGCSIAMALCLRELGKDVTVWNQDGMLEKYAFLPCSDLVTQPPVEAAEFEVAIALDTAAEDRIGTCRQAVKHAKTWINIDHHVSNNHYGDLAFIDTSAPATGQILHDFFRSQNLPLTKEMAENLFAAISTDTGSFQYPNTTARTYEIGAELIEAGVNVGRISQQLYESYPRRRVQLLRELLNVLKFTCDDRVASFGLSLETAARIGALPEDNEGLIDYIRAIDGVLVAAFFEELPQERVRISLRSKDPCADVQKVCAQFGGGGHTLAAGARARGTLAEVEAKVLQSICHEIGH
ncbi:MAG: bifunctional oligoribonuclease and phosphatase NrnA [Chthoniobacter sp.]|jgi:phosphoesterase RecJ-like protein|nr:bifunctional oligoribonuclease and phosphatase NrnA [Chthoniobacter sp.]